MGKVIFVTNRHGVKVLHDKEGLIGKFTDSKNDIVETDEGLKKNSKIENIWFLAFDEEIDTDKIARVRKLKSYGSSITETKNEITVAQLNNLRQTNDPNKMTPEVIRKIASEEAKAQYDNDKRQYQIDMRRYGQLFSTICKNGGGYVKDADPALIKEFEELKAKHEIEEETVEEKNEKINE
ncbi:MAG: hypothetical protein WC998_05890 [Candidatus Paceibacterota bacterium]|jgi:hypothetical protein